LSRVGAALNSRAQSFGGPMITQPKAGPDTRVFFWPDYSLSNAYQAALARAFPPGWRVTSGTLEVALWQLGQGTGEPVVFHLHWTTPVVGGAVPPLLGRANAEAFLLKLRHFVEAGGRLVWTVHNVLPHERGLEDIEASLCQGIADLATVVHLHSASALERMAPHYTVPPEKVLVVPHPSYVGVYPDTIDRAGCRARLGLKPHQTLFLFLGQIRAYKGLEDLFAAFQSLVVTEPDAFLVVSGVTAQPGQAKDMAMGIPQVTVREGFVPDETLQVLYKAADYAVLPYRDILTSGSALAAWSFGCPVIAPDLPAIIDYTLGDDEAHEAAALTFRKGNPASLLLALRQAMMEDAETRAARRDAARAVVAPHTWDRLAQGIVDRLTAG